MAVLGLYCCDGFSLVVMSRGYSSCAVWTSHWTSQWEVAQMVKHLPTTRETQFQSLGWKDPLEKEMTTHSVILA